MPLTVTRTALHGVLILEPPVFTDARGFFLESFNARDFAAAVGVTNEFVQDNHSGSAQHVLRGLHYQVEHAQAKLVRVLHGEVYDVVVDLRRDSPTFRQWHGVMLSAENRRQLWVPEGFAHGYLVTSATAEVAYKATDFWYPKAERSLLWSDPELAIDWPLAGQPMLSAKDAAAPLLADAETFVGVDTAGGAS